MLQIDEKNRLSFDDLFRYFQDHFDVIIPLVSHKKSIELVNENTVNQNNLSDQKLVEETLRLKKQKFKENQTQLKKLNHIRARIDYEMKICLFFYNIIQSKFFS